MTMDLKSELEKEFDKKFISQEKFAKEIESFYQTNGYESYISAIADYCEENTIDIESVPKLLSKQFKLKIENQVARMNCLKIKPQAQLPF